MAAPPPVAAPKRRSGLASRLAIATTAVAALAVLVSGLVSLGLLRGATESEARQQLGRQADGYVLIVDRTVSLQGQRAVIGRFKQLQTLLTGQQILLEAISTSGQTCGVNSVQLPANVTGQVVAGQPVSAVARVGGARRFIEARPLDSEQVGGDPGPRVPSGGNRAAPEDREGQGSGRPAA